MITKLGQVTVETKGCIGAVDPDGSRTQFYSDGAGHLSPVQEGAYQNLTSSCP